MDLRCRCLGSLEVRDADEWRPLKGARARALLGVLIAHRGAHVSVGRLVSELWSERPPPSAVTLVRGYVLAVRRAFGADGARAVVSHARGYRLTLAPAEIDACRFDEAARAGQDALRRDEPAEAARLLGEALALFSGPALADVPPTPRVTAYAAGLDERRLTAAEDLIEAELRRGRIAAVLADLRTLVAEHPGRERLVGLWMRALDATGRRAEALDAYRHAHRRLADRTGIAPGPELTRLHERILAQDAPPPTRARVVAAEAGWAAPRQLPAALPDFVGRSAEVATCVDAFRATESGTRSGTGSSAGSGTGSGAVGIVAISGAPGVGKTALAVRVAHELRPVFPDGQLYAALRGGTDPAEVLGAFLRASGVPSAVVPVRAEERAALFRSRVADRRVLVVLDGAADEPQVRALLPGGAGCGVVVTGRTRLSGLEGACPVDLDVLPADDALALFRRVLGTGCDVPGELLEHCAGLPLALRIVATRAAAAPRTPLSWFAARLADPGRRLDELRVRDLDVRARLSEAWAALDGAQRRALRSLARAQSADTAALRALAEHRLVDDAGPDSGGEPRYGISPLIALFARENAA